jgi:hypothetical protein
VWGCRGREYLLAGWMVDVGGRVGRMLVQAVDGGRAPTLVLWLRLCAWE